MAITLGYLPSDKIENLKVLVNQALEQSGQVFSEMVGNQVLIKAPVIELIPLKNVADITGGPGTIGTGIYEAVTGDVGGHLLFFFSEESGQHLVDMVLEKPLGTTVELDDMDISALSELGNVTGSLFLNVLSDRTGMEICPSTPVVVTDMIGAILSAILAELSTTGDSALIVKTEFKGSQEIKGYFFLLPEPNTLDTILERLEA
ncbi:MAG: chemotaxis protein CheC [Thermincolia bacterium]